MKNLFPANQFVCQSSGFGNDSYLAPAVGQFYFDSQSILNTSGDLENPVDTGEWGWY